MAEDCFEFGKESQNEGNEDGKVYVSFSGGKDSTAMLLHMLELGEHIDHIVFADTGFEFPELLEYIDRIERYIGREIIRLNPAVYVAGDVMDENKAIIEMADMEGKTGLKEPTYPDTWLQNRDTPCTLFEKWFFGCVTSGLLMGQQRGFPKVRFPCWYSREAKVQPLDKMMKDAKQVCIGIASDEAHRAGSKPPFRYPLIEWGWSEHDCANYLDKRNLQNPLYRNWNRLGCYFCPKQNQSALFGVWKLYPEFWKTMDWWDKMNMRVTGSPIFYEFTIEWMTKKFERGFIPKGRPKYGCNGGGCDTMRHAFPDRQMKLV